MTLHRAAMKEANTVKKMMHQLRMQMVLTPLKTPITEKAVLMKTKSIDQTLTTILMTRRSTMMKNSTTVSLEVKSTLIHSSLIQRIASTGIIKENMEVKTQKDKCKGKSLRRTLKEQEVIKYRPSQPEMGN